MAQGRDSGFQYDLAGHYSSSMEIFVFGNIFKQKRRLLARIAGVGSWVNNSSDLKPLVNNFFKALVMGVVQVTLIKLIRMFPRYSSWGFGFYSRSFF